MRATNFVITAGSHPVDTSPDAFGVLRSSINLLGDRDALHQRMEEDGYLFLPQYLDHDEVTPARQAVCHKLTSHGMLDLNHRVIDAIAAPDASVKEMMKLAQDNPPLMKLLYSGRMIAFYEMFLGGPVRHYDYTWFRAVSPGNGTYAHCDVVYMGRGTPRLFTSWTPIGDVTLEDGGLMIMEGSNRLQRLRDHYCKTDVDVVCLNRHTHDGKPKMQNPTYGRLTNNPVRLRRNLAMRWLTADYKMGDLLIFSVFTIHCSLDNQGKRIRLSSDSRYQLASEPADERWISIDGQPPIAFGELSRQEMIC